MTINDEKNKDLDNELNISVKLKLFDWISNLSPRYKVELMLEGE